MKNVAFHNLGCKVNSYELDFVQQILLEKGYNIVPFEEKADIYIINTCTVTNIADRKSRQMLHRAKALNPQALVVALGCYVQTDKEGVLKDPCIDLAIGNNRKKDIARILEEYLEQGRRPQEPTVNGADAMDKTLGGSTIVDMERTHEYEEMQLKKTAEHTRAYIKIQDGCNQFCSYCIIPYARGRVRSRRREDVLKEIREMAAAGYREVVLTGIHISSYGIDQEEESLEVKLPNTDWCNIAGKVSDMHAEESLNVAHSNTDWCNIAGEASDMHAEESLNVAHSNTDRCNIAGEASDMHVEESGTFRRDYRGQSRLIELVEEIQQLPGLDRIRLGSLEPRIVTEDFAARLAACDKVCPHFHLSLQSGCDSVLKRMNRHYTPGEYLQSVDCLRRFFDHPAITTDVIVGFPGETEEEFEECRRFLEQVGFYEMHIFKYSRRRGTAADRMPGQLTDAVKTRRSNLLQQLEREQSKAFRSRYIGQDVEVLFEESREMPAGLCRIGHTADYIRVALPGEADLRGRLERVHIRGFLTDEILLADTLAAPMANL